MMRFWEKVYSTGSFTSKYLSTLLTNILLGIMALISGLLAARSLGPVGRGELAAIQTWPTFLATVAMVGIPEALVYYTARQPKMAGRLLSTSILIASIACVPFMVAGYILMPVVLQAQSPSVISAARGYLWLIPIMATIGILPNVLRGLNDLGHWNVMRAIIPAMWIIVLLINIVFITPTAINIAKGYLIGLLIVGVPYSWIVSRRLSGSILPSLSHVSPLLHYGVPLMLSLFPYTLNLRLDQMWMARIFNPDILGVYVVAVAWSGAVAPLLTALPVAMMPHIASIASREQQITDSAQIVRFGVLLALIISFLLSGITPLVLPLLFGSEYRSAVPASVILCIAAGIFSVNGLLEATSQSLGRPKFILAAETFGLLVTGISLWILLEPLKSIGAALASLVSYSSIFLILIYLVKKETGLGLTTLLCPNRSDLTLLKLRWRALKNDLAALI